MSFVHFVNIGTILESCKNFYNFMEIKVEVVGREIIKPSSPTPPHLKSFRLSRFDRGMPLCYTSVVLFYACNDVNRMEISKNLKESLSDVLTRLYPFAGRIKDNIAVDCNDEGVDFFEAQVNCPLSYLFGQPNLDAIRHLVPMESTEMTTNPLLLIQASSFICGGMALGVNICHKIADGTTLSTVIKAWTGTAIGMPDAVVPDLSVADLYPPVDSSPVALFGLPTALVHNNSEAMRIVFDAPKLDALKANVKGTENPTRVEVVLALLWKCAIKASLKSKTSSPMPHVMAGAANMRASLVPAVPTYACGNILQPLVVVISDETEIDLSYIVSRLRKAKEDLRGLSVHLAYDFRPLGLEKNKLIFTSWCRMPFYEADFGWGKPMWACRGTVSFYGFHLIDSQDGDGIEAWVKLNGQEMTLFEKDEELLAFGLINPSVLLN